MSDGDSVLEEEELVFVRDDEDRGVGEPDPGRSQPDMSAHEAAPAELPPVDDVQGRLRRFASLRAAHRAIAPSVPVLREPVAQARGQRLRERLEALAAQWKALDAAEAADPAGIAEVCEGFDAIDAELSALSEELRAHADAIDPVQLRSTLPDIAQRHRREVCGLLDLLIGDVAGLVARRPTIEYVVTVLSSTDDGSTRKIAYDPARLTPDMEALCEAMQADYGAVSEEYELAFFEAANVDASVDLIARVRELRAKKEELANACFLPGVLRAIVTYNVRMANEMGSAVRTSREDDLAFEDFVDSGELERSMPKSKAPAGPELDFVAPDLKLASARRGSIHESNGITQIWEALRRRLRKVPIGSCTSERIALAVDLSTLGEDELALLGVAESDADARLTASILLVGLLHGIFPAVESSLIELGVTREQLYEDWTQELDRDLRARIASLLAANEHEQACLLSEFKTRHLYASLSSVARERHDRVGLRGALRSAPEDSGTIEGPVEGDGSRVDRSGADPVAEPSLLRGFLLGKTETGRRIRVGLASGALVVMLIGLAANLVETTKSDVDPLRPAELAAISDHLETAYRDDHGPGALLIGRVGESWRGLTPEARSAAVLDMKERLLADGVRDAMIYDAERRLQLHLVGGELERPVVDEAPVGDASGSVNPPPAAVPAPPAPAGS